MTYLTRMTLNPARRDARRLLASPQVMHAAVMAAFPVDPQGMTSDGRVLWRLDRDPDPHRPLLYILSPEPPDLMHIVEKAGWPHLEERWETRDCRPLLDRLRDGQRWAFRLTANPVRRLPREGRGRGVVKAHVTAAQQQAWLLDQSADAGFEVAKTAGGTPALQLTERLTLAFQRQGRTVTVVSARFDGVLEVTHAGKLQSTMLGGLGRGKAYGCGLLTLAPV